MSELSLMRDLSLLSIEVYQLSNKFPDSEKYGLINQLKRAIISVRLNVREGNVFRDKRKNTHFLCALGSLVEVDECLLIAFDLRFINKNHFNKYRDQYWLCLNKLKKLINSINSK